MLSLVHDAVDASKICIIKIHEKYIKPRSGNEDSARREYVFNALLIGMGTLTLVGFVVSLTTLAIIGEAYQNTSPAIFLGVLVALALLYKASRLVRRNSVNYVLVGLYFMLGSYALYFCCNFLTHGLLLYVLAIVVSGVLLSVRASLILLSFIILSLGLLASKKVNFNDHPHAIMLAELPRKNLIVFIVIFFVIFLVSWLSNREIERSLKRARKSEELLKRERNMLEAKVNERSLELERAQAEKSLELYRFAEFGRLSASLLHDIANPLTAMSLNLEQLENKPESKVVKQMREGINCMDKYVKSARQQLNGQTSVSPFDSRAEIKRVISFLSPKSKNSQVKVKYRLVKDVRLCGNSSKFNQIIANLTANSIDAYENFTSDSSRSVTITSKKEGLKKLTVTVHDNGVGIRRSELSHIFNPFYTTKSNERGTGIGLTITKQIIEEDFEGTVEVSSSRKFGTTFKVELPIMAGDSL